ncbi:MAG: transcriptional repressor LexA [Acidobacteria bacterium]|nr:transcriptional repressor LexA [Acidobacteriota bacterium]
MALTPKQIGLHDFLSRFYLKHGYAPTIAEIQQHFQLNSPATVHEQLAALEREGLIRRQKYVQRGIELVESSIISGEFEIPLLGVVAAGSPIEAVLTRETITVAPDLYATRRFALRVRGDSMRDEQIADGDLIIVEPVENARNGETVVALVDDQEATVKKFYLEKSHIRLQPANENFKPIIVKPPQRVRVQGVVVGLIRRYR